jgi:DNA-binding transcriptional LysR family regulator
MELRHISYFVAVAEEGRIARAAERLDMQPPPLSQQIKAMERELDVQLFHRKARGVALTDAGRSLLEDARVVLAHLDRAFETTQRIARTEMHRGHADVSLSSVCAARHSPIPAVTPGSVIFAAQALRSGGVPV